MTPEEAFEGSPLPIELAREMMETLQTLVIRVTEGVEDATPCDAVEIIHSGLKVIHAHIHEVKADLLMEAIKNGNVSPADLLKMAGGPSRVEAEVEMVEITPDMTPAQAAAAVKERLEAMGERITDEVARSVASHQN
jgi:hypothetical protein